MFDAIKKEIPNYSVWIYNEEHFSIVSRDK